MADKYSQLETEFMGIRDERGLHANTATRIGTAFLELLYLLRKFGIYEDKWASEDYVKGQQGFAIYKEDGKWTIEIDNAQIRNVLEVARAIIEFAEIESAKIEEVTNRTKFLQGLQTFASILLGNFASGVEGGIITAEGDAELRELVCRALAHVDELLVDGDSVFGGRLSSIIFNSGFLTGQGWAITKNIVINAAGVEEEKYHLEIDDVTVRGLLRVYSLVVSQLRGEFDNYRFAAMMEVHHYDPETGKIWLSTEGGRIVANPFNSGTYVECQQYQPGNDVVSGGDGYINKIYEFIVDDFGTGGMKDESGDRLDWITFKNFTTRMEGASPRTLIKKGDTIVRSDHLTDPERKGVIDIMTVGPQTPYLDIVYGRKTIADYLKGRIGNLEGVRTDLFGWLEGFGAYIANLYGVGKFFNAQTGEGLSARIEGTRQQLKSLYTETTYNISDDDNFIKNGFFQRGLDDWGRCQVDGTTSEEEEERVALSEGGEPLLFNGNLLAWKNRLTAEPVEKDGVRMLHIITMGVYQNFSKIKANSTHMELESSIDDQNTNIKTVRDTLYMGIRILPVTAGTLSFKFRRSNGTSFGWEHTVNAGHDWQLFQAMDTPSSPWDYSGSGKLVVAYTGECYIRFVALQSDPIINSKTEYSTLITQNARRITLTAQKASDDLRLAVAEINITFDEVRQTVTDNKEAADAAFDTINNTVIPGIVDRLVDVETESENSATWISSTKDRIALVAAQFDDNGNLSNTSGLVTTAGFSTMFAQAYDDTGIATDVAQLTVKYDEISTVVTDNKDAADAAFDNINNTVIPGIEGRLDDVETESSNSATWISSNKTRIALVAAQFDDDGNLSNTSGLVVTSEFSTLFSQAYDDTGIATDVSQLSVKYDEISTVVTDNKAAADTAFDNINNTVIPGIEGRLDTVETESGNSATWISSNKKRIALVAAQFDDDGNLSNTSGLVVTSEFSTLFSQNYDNTGIAQEVSELTVKYDDIYGKVSTLTTEMSGAEDDILNAKSRLTTLELSNTSLIASVSKWSHKGVPVNNTGEFELGYFDTVSGATYSQASIISTNRMRSKNLFRCTTATFCTCNTGYRVGLVFFNANRKVHSSKFSGWKTPDANGVCTFSIVDAVKYCAICVCYDNDRTISSEKSFIEDSGISISSDSLVSQAEIALFITEEDLSVISLSADQIDFTFTKNTTFFAKSGNNYTAVMNLYPSGDLEIKGSLIQGSQIGTVNPERINPDTGEIERKTPDGTWVPNYAGRYVKMISSNTTLNKNHDFVVSASNSSDITITLPPASNGKVISIQNTGRTTKIMNGSGSSGIKTGGNTKTYVELQNQDRGEFTCNGTYWFAVFMSGF